MESVFQRLVVERNMLVRDGDVVAGDVYGTPEFVNNELFWEDVRCEILDCLVEEKIECPERVVTAFVQALNDHTVQHCVVQEDSSYTKYLRWKTRCAQGMTTQTR